MQPVTAYLIDPVARTITVVEHDGLTAMQKLIGGYLEVAYQWRTGEVLYVDEEGLYKPGQRCFALRERPDQLLAGRGLLVGRERVTNPRTGAFVIDPPAMTRADLIARVGFPIG